VNILVILSAGGMGDATEADFDRYTSFVCERLSEPTDDDIETINEALSDLWAEWCEEGAP
jgi:hypothetical protein